MKKSLLALAVLGAFAGAASAQSSVTLYGIVDANVGKDVGSTDKRVGQGAGSRLGVRGVEDLGGGLGAVFQLEHRFDSGTGQTMGQVPSTMWNARAYVGLQGGFGKLLLGREYTASFWQQLFADPWGWDTVASTLTTGVTGGGIAGARLNNAITYSLAAGGFSLAAQVAESNTNGTVCNASLTDPAGPCPAGASASILKSDKKPYNLGVAYDIGGFSVGVGYENPGDADDKWTTVRASYKFGAVKLGGFYGKGTNAAAADVKAMMFTLTADVGAGQIRAAYGDRKVADTSNLKGFALGYHHNVSKRTVLYADYVNNSKAATEKNGYDVGIKHSF